MKKYGRYEKRKEKSSHRYLWWLIPMVMLALILIVGFAVNRWTVELTLIGDAELQIECGSDYTDPGAEAYLTASLFNLKPREMTVTVSGDVDPATPGDYELVYEAGFLWYHGKTVRTVHVADTTPPTIELQHREGYFPAPGEPYEEEGYTAWDTADGDLTAEVVRREQDGNIYYTVTDKAGNTAEAVRKIVDTTPPELTLEGGEALELTAGVPYEEPGFTATDDRDGDLTAQVVVDGQVNCYHAGDYEITYTVTDAYGNTTAATRTVKVLPIQQPDRVDPGDKIVYLTFDDGPGPYTAELLDVLDRYNVKATFFVVDTGYYETIGEEYRRGHTVGIHSATHNYGSIYASEDAYFSDLNEISDIIFAQTGHRPNQVRFPGGSSNTVSCFNPGIMTRLTQALTDMGYEYYDWNVLSGDAGETTDTDVVVQNVIDGISNHNVSIVLQHDIKGFSVAAVERIIIWGLSNGYTFLPLTPGCPTAHHGLNN